MCVLLTRCKKFKSVRYLTKTSNIEFDTEIAVQICSLDHPKYSKKGFLRAQDWHECFCQFFLDKKMSIRISNPYFMCVRTYKTRKMCCGVLAIKGDEKIDRKQAWF